MRPCTACRRLSREDVCPFCGGARVDAVRQPRAAPLRTQIVCTMLAAFGLDCGSSVPSYGFPCMPSNACKYDPDPPVDAGDPFATDGDSPVVFPDAGPDAPDSQALDASDGD